MHTAINENITVKIGERRKHPRFSQNMPVQACRVVYPISDDDISNGNVCNISQDGALLDIPSQFESGELLQLYMDFPAERNTQTDMIRIMKNSSQTYFTPICKVIRVEANKDTYNTAVRFINVDPDDYCALQGFLEILAQK